ncbi:hypothetical protein pb186bvf_011239 [Paramecium bursaria]
MSEDEFQEGEIINEEQDVQGDLQNNKNSNYKQGIVPIIDNIQYADVDQSQQYENNTNQLEAQQITHAIIQDLQEQIIYQNRSIDQEKKDQINENGQNLVNQLQLNDQQNLVEDKNYNKINDSQLNQLNPKDNQIENGEDQKQFEFSENQSQNNQNIDHKQEPKEEEQNQYDKFQQDKLQISQDQSQQQVFIQAEQSEEIQIKQQPQEELVEKQVNEICKQLEDEQNSLATNTIIEEQPQHNKIELANEELFHQVYQQKQQLHQNDDEDFEEGEIILLENQNQNQNHQSDFQPLEPYQQIQIQKTLEDVNGEQTNQQQAKQQEIQNIPDDDFQEGEIINECCEQSYQNQQIVQNKLLHHDEDDEEIIQENQDQNINVQQEENFDDEFEDGEIIQDNPSVQQKINEDGDEDFIEGNVIEESQTQSKPIESQPQYYNISSLTNENFQELFNSLIQIYGVTPPRIKAYQQKEFQYNLQLQNIIPEETIQQLYLQEKNNQNASGQLQELFLEQIKHNFDIWQNYTAYQNQLKDYDIKLDPVNFEQIISAEKQSDPQLNNSPRVINLTFKNKAPKSMFFNDESFNSSPNKSNSPQKIKPTQPKVEVKLKQKSPPKIKVSTSPTTPRDVPVTSPVSVSNILDLIPDYSYLLSNTILVKE